ncbi:MAG: hypoxanthine phosphoribosyltransferase, partial [Erysipelotrichia bacterium]|nr:hypoxanthine phosphoribosyltransferase [Erysipelotrichia bacterium]
MEDNIKEVFFSQQQIIDRCDELGRKITADYAGEGKAPLVVALLRGSVPFLAELIKHIHLDIQYDFMDVTSYEGTESIGDIKIIKDLDTSVKGLDILLVEDIVDTGRTIRSVRQLMMHKGASSVKVVTLLDKPSRRVVEVKPEYIGFEVSNEFVVGYGMDYNQRYR